MNIWNVLWNEMIFCLPYEVCDCLSKSIASIAFTARFNFLCSDVIKGWFRTGNEDFWINEQMYPSPAAPSPRDAGLISWFPSHPRSPKTGDRGTAVPLFTMEALALLKRAPQALLWASSGSLGRITLTVNNGTLRLSWWKWNTPDIYNSPLGTGMRKEHLTLS